MCASQSARPQGTGAEQPHELPGPPTPNPEPRVGPPLLQPRRMGSGQAPARSHSAQGSRLSVFIKPSFAKFRNINTWGTAEIF